MQVLAHPWAFISLAIHHVKAIACHEGRYCAGDPSVGLRLDEVVASNTGMVYLCNRSSHAPDCVSFCALNVHLEEVYCGYVVLIAKRIHRRCVDNRMTGHVAGWQNVVCDMIMHIGDADASDAIRYSTMHRSEEH